MMRRIVLSATCLSLLFCSAAQVEAFQLGGGDVTLDVDVGVKYGAAWRIEEQKNALLADSNSDDGNRSFEDGDIFKNRFDVIADIDLRYKDFGVFVRPRAFYDKAYDGTSANDSLTNNNTVANGGTLSSSDKFSDATKERHRDDAEILDAYLYGSFALGRGRYVDVRVGQQVVSWGESLYVQNSVSSAMGPLDATASNSPGTELKEIFLPTEQAYLSVDLFPGVSISGFYQWEWEKSRLNEQGSYFSDNDGLDEAGERYFTGIFDTSFEKAGSENARDDGQYGISLRYTADWLNDTEFGFHFVNYHDKYPTLSFNGGAGGTFSPTGAALGAAPVAFGQITGFGYDADGNVSPIVGGFVGEASFVGNWGNLPVYNVGGGVYLPMGSLTADPDLRINPALANSVQTNWVDLSSYSINYVEDIKLFGMSFGTELGDINFGGEFTYRDGVPLSVKRDSATNFLSMDTVLGEAFQAQLSFISISGLSMFWDQLSLKGELGYNTVHGYGDNELVADKDAWGGTVVAEFEYLQVLQGLDMIFSVDYSFNPDGVSSLVASFEEGADEVGVGLDFTYMVDYEFGIQYVEYLGTPEEDSLADRDYFAFTAKYTF